MLRVYKRKIVRTSTTKATRCNSFHCLTGSRKKVWFSVLVLIKVWRIFLHFHEKQQNAIHSNYVFSAHFISASEYIRSRCNPILKCFTWPARSNQSHSFWPAWWWFFGDAENYSFSILSHRWFAVHLHHSFRSKLKWNKISELGKLSEILKIVQKYFSRSEVLRFSFRFPWGIIKSSESLSAAENFINHHTQFWI